MLTVQIPGAFFATSVMKFRVKIESAGGEVSVLEKPVSFVDVVSRGRLVLPIDPARLMQMAGTDTTISLEPAGDAALDLTLSA